MDIKRCNNEIILKRILKHFPTTYAVNVTTFTVTAEVYRIAYNKHAYHSFD